ncbi:MAG: hypothetical protein GXP59_05200 [Deltaproteobacteria bacterium]|nr:hypothetical protein [Deltaproteobacteria bacterium]
MGKFCRSKRYDKNLTIDLFLRDDSASSLLAGPVPCSVHGLSSCGVDLILDHIHFNGHHMFYAPQDKPGYQLYIGQQDDDKGLAPIPVRPICFNIDDSGSVHYFQLGVEFMTRPEGGWLTILKNAAAVNADVSCCWLKELLLKFWR